ncbi:hypothetical protein FEM48_Zijuj06G0087200 [Ziziphus jujuba var. spinosa]|uniref:POX domain-containing protein n=1 Tax=Ziziphus jujuba var. spinosa TaxID=714518 RepID=A0A978V8A2_ZIZJJ|nr:hypothetical protein FEM48_Zijuj06G0087200 [Ziziphus jujuba var. spinosa]
MVSQDSPPHPSSNILRQFIVSDSITNQTQFENQQFDPYGSTFRGGIAFPPSLGVLPSIQSLGERMSRSIDLVQAPSVAEESEISQTRHLMDLLGAANESNQHAQRLSLSLGSHMFVPPVQYRQRSLNPDLMNPSYLLSGEEAREACNVGVGHVTDDYSFAGSGLASSSTSLNRPCSTLYGAESLSTVIGQSRYLKPAQLLLEEIVNVGGKAVEISNEKYIGKLCGGGRRGAMSLSSELKAELCSSGVVSADKHEFQMKIAKLIALLEEVEGRYEKYYHQMKEVMASFEMIAGLGAAKCYTALALQAMSRHFCSLRDAIVSHINVERRKLLQDLPKISTGLSQLSLLDRESRQNRMSLQQLGIVQSQRQAWRPIRGLPETSVAILRAWLFEHFLHPVRLWKPMIEEMYKEEFGDSSEDSNPLVSGSMTGEAVTDHEED